LFAGESLETLSQKLSKYQKQTTKLRHGSCSLSFNMGYQLILNITSLGESDPTKLDGELFSEEKVDPNNSDIHIYSLNLVKEFLFLLFGKPDQVTESMKRPLLIEYAYKTTRSYISSKNLLLSCRPLKAVK
jgi:hypothetical protein